MSCVVILEDLEGVRSKPILMPSLWPLFVIPVLRELNPFLAPDSPLQIKPKLLEFEMVKECVPFGDGLATLYRQVYKKRSG